ncbi:hypothetical protein L6452_35501 [Arctium lappa]|uniref:Uncharacterized protein n=1 Tax=Arctium lappa TaxID=4217 RepID=A0ACB8Y6M3_ARCLA|nr:hypothetical protein L6452_35501 [Arctium lappa]
MFDEMSAKQSRVIPPSFPPPSCPRCTSHRTKFSYYNNKDVSQPRYFCKNCSRFWTHGGTFRDVPNVKTNWKLNSTKIASSFSKSENCPSFCDPLFTITPSSSSSPPPPPPSKRLHLSALTPCPTNDSSGGHHCPQLQQLPPSLNLPPSPSYGFWIPHFRPSQPQAPLPNSNIRTINIPHIHNNTIVTNRFSFNNEGSRRT